MHVFNVAHFCQFKLKTFNFNYILKRKKSKLIIQVISPNHNLYGDCQKVKYDIK